MCKCMCPLFRLFITTLGKYFSNDTFTLGKYWPGIKRAAPQIASSLKDAQKVEEEEADTVTALASLSMRVVQNGGMEK